MYLCYSLIEEFVCLTERFVSRTCCIPVPFYWCISVEFATSTFEWLLSLLLLLLLYVNALSFRICQFCYPVVSEFMWGFLGYSKYKDIHWNTLLCHIILWDLWPTVMLMCKFVALLSSVGTTSQVVPMVGASTRINYIIR